VDIWVTVSLFVCLCECVYVFVRLRISLPRIKLAASNFARRFIGVQGRESQILRNFAPPEAQNRTNSRGPRPADKSDRDVTCVACGRRIGMCGYTAVPEDGRSCFSCDLVYHDRRHHRPRPIWYSAVTKMVWLPVAQLQLKGMDMIAVVP